MFSGNLSQPNGKNEGWVGRQACRRGAPTWELKEPRGAERPTCPRWDTGEGTEQRRGLLRVVVEALRWLWWSGSLGPLSRWSWANVC